MLSGGVGINERRDASLSGLETFSIVACIEVSGGIRMIVLPRSLALVVFALAPVLMLSWPAGLLAQDYPTHPVKIIVPFGAGGPADVYSRVLAQHLSDALKQPSVVADRP